MRKRRGDAIRGFPSGLALVLSIVRRQFEAPQVRLHGFAKA